MEILTRNCPFEIDKYSFFTWLAGLLLHDVTELEDWKILIWKKFSISEVSQDIDVPAYYKCTAFPLKIPKKKES